MIDWTAGTLAFIGQDFPDTVVHELYADADTLARLINSRIQGRTMILTGALVSSEQYEVNHNPSSADLVVFYASDAEQLASWGRVYVEYQEGGALGKPTYTNPPREMYARVETEDMDLIDAWAQMAGDTGVNKLAAGMGIPLP